MATPQRGIAWGPPEPPQAVGGVLRRPGFTCALAGLLAVAVRLLLLPLIPIPVPAVHDEFSYLLGADTFAAGRLTNPPHPMWVHFETFHVNFQPTYCSKYPPAQSLFLAFGINVFGNPWFGVCLSVGVMFAAICWMLQGWVSPGYALLTTLIAIFEWGLTTYWINSYWGGAVAAMGGALVIGAAPRIARRMTFATVLTASVGTAILANSRPYEGLLTVISSAAVLAWWMWRKKSLLASFRLAMAPFLLVIVPCLAAMGYYNYRLTGSPTRFPYVVNESMYSASPRFFLLPPIPTPVYRHEIIRKFWVDWAKPYYPAARANPLAQLAFFLEPRMARFYLGTLLGFAALAGLMLGRRSVVIPALAILSLPVLGLLMEITFLGHYLAPVCSAYLIVVAAGLEALERWRVRLRWAGAIVVILVAGLALGSWVSNIAGVARAARRGPMGIETRPLLIQKLQGQGGRHLVIVRYAAKHSGHAEWVYNRADIDHSDIVWAREMGGQQNQELLDYYRDRKVWLLEPDMNPMALTPYPHAPR